MPLFDFKCKECGHEFEELVSRSSYLRSADAGFSDAVCGHYSIFVRCPECNSLAIDKTVSLIANTPAKWGENGARESLAS